MEKCVVPYVNRSIDSLIEVQINSCSAYSGFLSTKIVTSQPHDSIWTSPSSSPIPAKTSESFCEGASSNLEKRGQRNLATWDTGLFDGISDDPRHSSLLVVSYPASSTTESNSRLPAPQFPQEDPFEEQQTSTGSNFSMADNAASSTSWSVHLSTSHCRSKRAWWQMFWPGANFSFAKNLQFHVLIYNSWAIWIFNWNQQSDMNNEEKKHRIIVVRYSGVCQSNQSCAASALCRKKLCNALAVFFFQEWFSNFFFILVFCGFFSLSRSSSWIKRCEIKNYRAFPRCSEKGTWKCGLYSHCRFSLFRLRDSIFVPLWIYPPPLSRFAGYSVVSDCRCFCTLNLVVFLLQSGSLLDSTFFPWDWTRFR